MVEQWKKRREEIEVELRHVTLSQGDTSLPPPEYVEKEEDREESMTDEVADSIEMSEVVA